MDPLKGETIIQLFIRRVSESHDQTAIRFKSRESFESKSWSELAGDVHRLAAGLIAAGIRPGDHVAQLSENRYEWILADLAIQLAQAIHVPIHAPLAASQVEFQINHSESKLIFVSGSEQLEKIAAVADKLPQDLIVVHYDASTHDLPQKQIPLSEWWAGESPAAAEIERAAIADCTADNLATILYTSGTTGEPKGVMLTQRNLVSNAIGTIETFEMADNDTRLSFLPLSHIFARTCDLYTWIGTGCLLALAQSRDTVLQDCAEIKPTIMNGVPYFFDRLLRGLQQHGQAETPGALRHLLGGNIKYCCSGGAALPDHLFDFFQTQEVPILQGYGLTETSPVISMSTPRQFKRGASGQAIPGVEVCISDEGEILTRGPLVMKGYWKNDQATREVIVNEWFHTGDLGHVDEDGFVWITGRKKELIVTAAGKNIAPVLLESLLTEAPLIDQALVIGDGRNYLTALIVPNLEQLKHQLADLDTSDIAVALSDQRVQDLFAQQIEKQLKPVSYHEQVRRFSLIERAFSIENGEMTAKLSLRRPIIEANFADRIKAMYNRKREA
ncbi:MAG: AMP-dependent synthetase/ligase [Pirellulaceae bacterium]|nr:AMP-dependent synthetase/ligase [Pirellulaceae bacterium]